MAATFAAISFAQLSPKDRVDNAATLTPAKPSVNPITIMKDQSATTATTALKQDSAKVVKTETATFAGGCFWGMQEIIRKIPGVIRSQVGYTGGKADQPSYQLVCTGGTGHAEAVEITFDPSVITYEKLLGYFFRMHDPTTLNRQHNDVGTQYRSAIFYHSDTQKQTAEAVKARVNKSGKWKQPVVTEITKAGPFWSAEGYHQDYLQKNPFGYNCHVLQPE